MNPGIIAAIVVVAIIVVAAVAWLAMRKRRTDDLRDQFGPEYDRAVDDTGDERKAESVLVERRKRVEALNTRKLTDDEHDRFTTSWRNVQAQFVDNPPAAIAEADVLISEVMRVRGYPTDMEEQREDVISVEHPEVMNDFRTAHEIADRSEQGNASTEDLRAAMLKYRVLFDGLVGEGTADTTAVKEQSRA